MSDSEYRLRHAVVSIRDDLSEEEAVALVAKAIRAGIFNDLGSGSNVDVCIIRKDGVDYRRNMEFLQVQFLPDAVSTCPAGYSRYPRNLSPAGVHAQATAVPILCCLSALCSAILTV